MCGGSLIASGAECVKIVRVVVHFAPAAEQYRHPGSPARRRNQAVFQSGHTKITIIMDAPEGECQASLRAHTQEVMLFPSGEPSLKLVNSVGECPIVNLSRGESMSRALAILVTGAAGRIGRAAVRELVESGFRVRAFDVVRAGGTDDVVVGSITDPETVRRAVEGIDVLIHLAATPDDDDFLERLLPNNLVGAYHVLEEARLAGVRKMVLASSGQVVWWQRFTGPLPVKADAQPSPRGWYAATKLFQEAAGRALAAQYGISVIAARLGWCPRDRAQVEELGRTDWGPDVYFSPADAGRFFACAVEAPLERRFEVVYAISRPSARDLRPGAGA